jgi:shikimate kinase
VPEQPIVLVGMMGAGKSTVGKSLAKALDIGFVDNDSAIAQSTGRRVADLVRNDEPSFRKLEAEMIADKLQSSDPFVFSLGGGAVIAPATRAVLKERATVVWLYASHEVLMERVAKRLANRPMLDGDPSEKMKRLLDERTPLYSEVANIKIDVSRLPRFRVVEKLKELVK